MTPGQPAALNCNFQLHWPRGCLYVPVPSVSVFCKYTINASCEARGLGFRCGVVGTCLCALSLMQSR